MKCVNESCGIETNNPKFCSRKCSAIVSNKLNPKRKLKTLCSTPGCGSIVKSYRHTKCGRCFQEYLNNRTSNKKLVELRTRCSVQGKHPSWANVHVRHHARAKHRNLLKLPCFKCGYSKHVELCHKKPVSSFDEDTMVGEVNARENIVQLCPNCHWEFDRGLFSLD